VTGMIKAIPVRAYGCHFRSTLEYRWATFFTAAGFDWEYEPEGAALDAGNYLCDFRITGPNGVRVWVEVKPKLEQDQPDDPRWAELAAKSGMMLFTVRGMHRVHDRCESAHNARVWMPDGTVADVHRLWQGKRYEAAWDAASEARPDRPGKGPRRRRGKR